RTAGDAYLERVLAAQRLELFRQRIALGFLDARTMADVDQASFVVVQAEEERADGAGTFAVAEAADDAVGGLEVLDLDHAVAVARVIRLAQALGHDAIESGTAEFVEPVVGDFALVRRRRKADQRSVGNLLEESLQQFAALFDRLVGDRFPFHHQKIEREVMRRNLLRELADPRLRRMNALQEIIEGQPPADWYDAFAVDDE